MIKSTKRLDSNVGASHCQQINPFLVSAEEKTSVKYKPRIWGNIETTEDFLYVIEVLEIAKEEDIVELHIDSGGGSLDAGITLIHAMQKCAAPIHVVMSGTCASLATMLMFYADSWEAAEFTSFLFHEAIVGTPSETMSANRAYSEHVYSTCEELLRTVYKGFFTEEEFEDLLNGKQFFMSSQDVVERFQKRIELQEKEITEQSKPKPKAKPNAKPKTTPARNKPKNK